MVRTMRLLIALCALTLALPASAGSYTITTTAGQDVRLTRALARANKQTCISAGISAGCTRAQARDAWCQKVSGKPAPCTAGSRSSADIDIYPDVQSFLSGEVVRLVREQWGPQGDADLQRSYLDAAAKGTQAQKDAACVALGLPAGCLP
jgi:hypothetical protein